MGRKKRLCLFAGFDKDGEIADYVIYYLKALSQIADVYYWGDFETTEAEKVKLKPYCKGVYCKRHGKYDFGSWQELIRTVGRKEIEKYDELILANDSCYGPLFDLSKIIREMDSKKCDFWGLSSAYGKHLHLQSYFIVLKNSVIRSDVLYNFFENVKNERSYHDVCMKYEGRFTYVLNKAGFSFCSYIDYGELDNHPYKDTMAAIKNRQFPLLKVKFFLGGIRDQAGVADWRKVIQQSSDYPIDLIEEDLVRRGFELEEIDRLVREKQSEAPNFYSKGPIVKRILKRIFFILIKPLLLVMDMYTGDRTAPFFYKIDRINKSHRQLQQKYDELRAQIEPDFSQRKLHLEASSDACGLEMSDIDACFVRRFDLEMPPTNESEVLIIGNISAHSLASMELYDQTTIFLNNNHEDELGIECEKTNNLCDFRFKDDGGHQAYFDFILVEPFKKATKAQIKAFVGNIKGQMISESVLVMLVPEGDRLKYEDVLRSEGFCWANEERGLVVWNDPYKVYCDKMGSIKGYKSLIYKIK